MWYDAADVQIFGFRQEFTYTNGVDLCAGCEVFNKGPDSSEVKTQNPPPHFFGHFCYDASTEAVVGFLQEYSERIKK